MRCALALALLALTLPAVTQSQRATRDQRMKWWREARFGLFIHWGLYSIPAGKWGDQTSHAEWIRDTAHIPIKQYEQFQGQFNPTKFNADDWVAMAKDAGMKYIVITTKHHDGFNLFRSKYTDWDIAHTPFQRDPIKELADATRKQGLHIGFYHSIMDWHEPDYLPRRGWEEKDRPVDGAKFSRYETYLHNEVSELLTDYGPVDLLWFDGQWESTWNPRRGKALLDLCRRLSPNTIVNDRVSNGLPHMGDYSTPEQYIPDTGIPGDWETCMTMNDHWGYNAYDHDWKSTKDLIQNVVDIVSKGGNYLLNVGPMADGEFPPEAVERLHEIGQWMHMNGDSIYGTQASVFDGLPWGRSTTKPDGANTILYLQVFDWPKDGHLVVPAIGNAPLSARLLANGADLEVSREGQNIVVSVPAIAPSDICSTIALEVAGPPVVYKTPVIETPADVLISPIKATIQSSPHLDVRYTLDGSDPAASSPLYTKAIMLTDTTTIKAAAFENDRLVSSVSTKTVTNATPWPATEVRNPQPGWTCKEYKGDFDDMPDFDSLTPCSTFVGSRLDFPKIKQIAEEYVGRVYAGLIDVPQDDVYNFGLTSDDGSRLWIDGQPVVDNDGLHSAAKKNGVAPLAKGRHAIRVEWFNKTGDSALAVEWNRVGSKPQPLSPRSITHGE